MAKTNRSKFAERLAQEKRTHIKRAIAFLFYYFKTQELEERTVSDLANDLQEEGFPRPHVTNLRVALKKSRMVVRGNRADSYRINIQYLQQLDNDYGTIIYPKSERGSDSIIPADWVAGTRGYLEKLVAQINSCFDNMHYDACAVLCRRLMESLIIAAYQFEKRQNEIKSNGSFIRLERLIQYITADNNIDLSKTTPKAMILIKELGDRAAHHRSYITPEDDISDLRAKFRQVIHELLVLAGIAT